MLNVNLEGNPLRLHVQSASIGLRHHWQAPATMSGQDQAVEHAIIDEVVRNKIN